MDCQKSFFNCVKNVLPDTTIYWCVFKVLRAIFDNLKKIVTSEDDNILYDAVKNKIWLLAMALKSLDEVNSIIKGIRQELLANEKFEFLEYINTNYFDNDILPLWIYAYRKSYSRTNNISESLNNILKNRYSLKINQRSDNFLSYLINVILPDFIYEAQYLMHKKVDKIKKMPEDNIKYQKEKKRLLIEYFYMIEIQI